MIRIRRSRGIKSDWLGLSEASALLGVAPTTMRRWSDAGTVSVFTTPGGHRRYHREAIERLLSAGRTTRAVSPRSGITTARLARIYRKEAREVAHQLPWLAKLDNEQREWFRAHGRRLAEALLQHIDALDEAERKSSLTEASAEAAAYGRMTADLGVSLSQAVEGFLQFRRPFLHQVRMSAMRQTDDPQVLAALVERAEKVMDTLLLGAMSGHTVEPVAEPYEPSIPTTRRL